jgi:hypothetical protein
MPNNAAANRTHSKPGPRISQTKLKCKKKEPEVAFTNNSLALMFTKNWQLLD